MKNDTFYNSTQVVRTIGYFAYGLFTKASNDLVAAFVVQKILIETTGY